MSRPLLASEPVPRCSRRANVCPPFATPHSNNPLSASRTPPEHTDAQRRPFT